MRVAPLVLLALIAWPIGEIAVFVWVGSHIGVINTIGLVLLAGFAGLALIRIEGFNLLRRLQGEFAAGRMPAGELLEAFFILAAAILLLLPGFISDVLALFLLFAPVRRLIAVWVGGVVEVRTATSHRRPDDRDGGIVDLDADEYRRHEPGTGQSPWSDGPAALPPRPDRDDPDRP